MDSLYFTNSAVGIARSFVARERSMPQNWRGRFFSISGKSNCIWALLVLHASTKLLSASMVCVWRLPYCLIAFLYARLDVEHYAENHGARCLSHLLGFVNSRWVVVTSTTPAAVAWSSRNCSARADRSSFEMLVSSMMARKANANSSVDVTAVHTFALCA